MDSVLTVEDVAKALAVCPETIRRYARRGSIKAFKYQDDGDWRFKEKDVVFFLKKCVSKHKFNKE